MLLCLNGIMRDSSRVRSGYGVLHKFAVAQQSALALLPLNGLVHTPDLVYTYSVSYTHLTLPTKA